MLPIALLARQFAAPPPPCADPAMSLRRLAAVHITDELDAAGTERKLQFRQ